MTAELGIRIVHVLPVSALEGDNIVERSDRTPWYDGPALLELLESCPAQRFELDRSSRTSACRCSSCCGRRAASHPSSRPTRQAER